MKLEKFKSGTYDNYGDYMAFRPSEINHAWTWESSKLNFLLAEANKELGGLNTYSELISDIDLYILMHIQVEANKSNKIEGTKTSIEEDMMDIEDVSPERRDDVQEIQNYVKAMNYGIKRIVEDDFPFTTRLICELHAIILDGVRGKHKGPGEFRKSQNWIGGSMPSNALYVPPAHINLPELLSDFDKFINSTNEIPALVKVAMIHYQFETLHPFLDGNGRIGRLIIPLFLLSSKELSKPCFYISDYFERNRSEYYEKLQKVRTDNDMIGWIAFFLRASIETARSAKEKFKNAVRQQDTYNEYLISKRGSSDSLSLIIHAMYKHPVATTRRICIETGLSSPTVNKYLKTLLNDNIVVEITGNKRNRVFALFDYINVFA
ncbi:MAG: Fic family protein [Lentihominibacter sp.]|jgi:Fic family protein